MSIINRLYATLLLIRHILVPAMKAERRSLPAARGSVIRVTPEAFASLLPELASCLRPDGRLELLFEAVLVPAAPFLLYHLKRNGFSESKAVITPEGIRLTARR
jgi:hypothetical protein